MSTYSHISLLHEKYVLSVPPTVLTTWIWRTIVVAMTLVSQVSRLGYVISESTPTHKMPVAKMAMTANLIFAESCKDQTIGIGKSKIKRSVAMLI